MASTHQAGALYNSLTAGSKIIGTVVADSDFRIDGMIEGDVQCKGRVVLGDHGIVKGDLTCQNADIMGTINGSLHVDGTLSLRATGSIIGDVKTKVLVIEPKAQFNGSCSMAQEKANGEEAKGEGTKVESGKSKVESKEEAPKVAAKTVAEKKREIMAKGEGPKANGEGPKAKEEPNAVVEPEIPMHDDVIAVFDEPEIIVEA